MALTTVGDVGRTYAASSLGTMPTAAWGAIRVLDTQSKINAHVANSRGPVFTDLIAKPGVTVTATLRQLLLSG